MMLAALVWILFRRAAKHDAVPHHTPSVKATLFDVGSARGRGGCLMGRGDIAS